MFEKVHLSVYVAWVFVAVSCYTGAFEWFTLHGRLLLICRFTQAHLCVHAAVLMHCNVYI